MLVIYELQPSKIIVGRDILALGHNEIPRQILTQTTRAQESMFINPVPVSRAVKYTSLIPENEVVIGM